MASEIAERLATKWTSRACEEGECADEIDAAIRDACERQRESDKKQDFCNIGTWPLVCDDPTSTDTPAPVS